MINKIEDIANSMGFDIDLTHDDVVDIDEVETIVLASGNLGLIYFTQWNKRLTYEKINDASRDIIEPFKNTMFINNSTDKYIKVVKD